MSRTFSTNSGSVDSSKVSLRCGCSEKAQTRCTVEGARPDALAIDRVLQCVAAAGSFSSVVVHLGDLVVVDLAWGTRAGLVDKPVQTLRRKPLAPGRHRDAGDAEPLRDRQVAHAVRREPYDLRPHRIRTSDLPPTCPRLQFAPLGVVQLNPDCSSPPHAPLPDPKRRSGHHSTTNMASYF